MAKGTTSNRSAGLKNFNTKRQKVQKLPKTSAIKKGNSSTNPYRFDKDGGKGNMRSRATINRLNMYRAKPDLKARKKIPTDPAAGRIEPDRRWFGNTRSLDQKELNKYMTALEKQAESKGSGHSILIKGRKLPVSMLKGKDIKSAGTVKLLDIEPFQETFGKTAKRKRPNLGAVGNLESMMQAAQEKQDNYDVNKDRDLTKFDHVGIKDAKSDKRVEAGQSKRIWEELYKVLDSSDVVIQVIDARDPMGTRTKHIEDHLKKNHPNKHLVLIMNKCDLVPTSVTQKWTKILQKEYPTIAFKASINNSFGKGALISLLRQFDNFHKDKPCISIGFIGYPNVGKSSIINTVRKKAVCKTAPIPGETKVWQYITLTKRINLIDCPGIVYNNEDTETDIVLKGVVRAEKLVQPETHVGAILERGDTKAISQIYGIDGWDGAEDFMEKLAGRQGRLLKGGDANFDAIARLLIRDWQRGKIPYVTLPTKKQIDDAEKIEKPSYNPALLTALHQKGEEDELEMDEGVEPIEQEVDV